MFGNTSVTHLPWAAVLVTAGREGRWGRSWGKSLFSQGTRKHCHSLNEKRTMRNTRYKAFSATAVCRKAECMGSYRCDRHLCAWGRGGTIILETISTHEAKKAMEGSQRGLTELGASWWHTWLSAQGKAGYVVYLDLSRHSDTDCLYILVDKLIKGELDKQSVGWIEIWLNSRA